MLPATWHFGWSIRCRIISWTKHSYSNEKRRGIGGEVIVVIIVLPRLPSVSSSSRDLLNATAGADESGSTSSRSSNVPKSLE